VNIGCTQSQALAIKKMKKESQSKFAQLQNKYLLSILAAKFNEHFYNEKINLN